MTPTSLQDVSASPARPAKYANWDVTVEEAWIQARLNSPLFGAMVHAAEMARPGVRADAVAARLFDAPPHTPDAYVNALTLQPCPEATFRELQDWPKREDSIFSLIRERGPREGICRPHLLADGDRTAHGHCEPLHALSSVVDAVCLMAPAAAGTSCCILLFRCGKSGPFEPHRLETLDRLRPDFARVLMRAGAHAGAAGLEEREGLAPGSLRPVSLLLARLSRTERRVLTHLRNRLTEREVAEQIHRSPHTVHVHVKNIYRKLGVSSRAELLSLLQPPHQGD